MIEHLSLMRAKRILIVEDDYLLADRTRRELVKIGAIIVGPVPSVEDALGKLEEQTVDAAILDINLDGESVYPLADILTERGIPFVFASAIDPSRIPVKYQGYVLCETPAELAVIAVALFAPEQLSH